MSAGRFCSPSSLIFIRRPSKQTAQGEEHPCRYRCTDPVEHDIVDVKATVQEGLDIFDDQRGHDAQGQRSPPGALRMEQGIQASKGQKQKDVTQIFCAEIPEKVQLEVVDQGGPPIAGSKR